MKRIAGLMAVLMTVLCCGGCGWLDGSFVSVTPHQIGYSDGSDQKIPAIADYIDLRGALIGMIDSGASEAVFHLDHYKTDDVRKDMIRAKNYIHTSHPIGAYSVESIDYEFGATGGQDALSVKLTYRHTRAEIDRIRTVYGIPGAQALIADALDHHRSALVLLVTGYQETDLVQWITDYAGLHPDVVMELPQVSVQTYPDQGDARVIELAFTYQNSRDSLHQMQEQVKPVFSSAALYVSGEADDQTKFSQLFTFLMERFEYRLETSLTPSYSLLCHGVGDSKAFAQVYSAMCRQAGLECQSVSGTFDGESRHWNLVQCGGVYYHVDLLRSAENGSLVLMDDAMMQAYVWDYDAYPAGGTPVPSATGTATE